MSKYLEPCFKQEENEEYLLLSKEAIQMYSDFKDNFYDQI